MPDAETLRATGNPPDRAILKKMAQFELIAMRIGPGPHLKGRQLPAGITPEEFDYTYTALTHAEMSRLGIYTIGEAYSSGVMIGLPPVMNFGPPALRDRIVNEVLGGDRTIALAVTEPHVGSDVANLTTTATLTADGRFYVVNGLKKWITNGRIMVNGKAQPSDYFTTAVRTGGPGMKGISVLVIPFAEGVSVRPIKTSGSSSAGTALVEFDNVKVPADHLLGKLNGGFPVIMTNFNKERWAMVSGILPACREVVTECYKWVNQREAFGKPLAKQPVLMHKLGAMTAELEAIQAYFDAITYAMNHLPAGEQAQKLAGPIALLKFRATRAMHQIVDDAVQIFGGRALTQTGMGQKVEHLQRVYKFGAILGGAEEILTSLAVRQAFRAFPPSARL
ncbi:acyl-CoA dehydrogenase NM domain-like protein [Caulochytrium protostelioides]|uniref:Acyl-CoA dehydrogenase NM domain-like protein n=1 Tax=Caulochytrium protostelioides TaxID=1555241 RepID=A0A4P9WX05_9FUNG|nr:acyl-CoA dehydrogenase NM domain-like protein [Caulochytrium protostelioides]